MRGTKKIFLQEALEGLTEFPRAQKADHPLSEILFTVFAGLLCGATTYADMAQLGMLRPELYQEYFPFRNGGPSAWTLRDVVSRLDPAKLHESLAEWMVRPFVERRYGNASDRKTSAKKTADPPALDSELLHLVCAASGDSQLVFGQTAGDAMPGDITLVFELLNILDSRGATITLGAADVRPATTGVLLEQGVDYLLTVGKNRRALRRELETFFAEARAKGMDKDPAAYAQMPDGRSGLLECWICDDVSSLPLTRPWTKVHGAAMVQYRTEQNTEDPYYVIFSRPGTTAEEVLEFVRRMRGSDGKLGWMLDVVWREEDGQAKTDHTDENLNEIRLLTIEVLRRLNDRTTRLRGLQQYCLLSDRYFNAAIERAGDTLNV